MELKQLIFDICSLMTVSGNECKSHADLISLVGKNFDEIKEDNVGNLLLIKRCGKENAPKIMIDTHFDEVGMIVTKVLKGGFLNVAPIGGIDSAIMQAMDVVIYGKETLKGVIASTPPHLRKDKDSKKLPKITELLIDTGYSEEEIRELVPIGSPVGYAPRYEELLGNEICGKSFDNKACAACTLYAVSETPKEILDADIYVLLSCHEETDRISGVAASAFAENPDYAVVIDVNLGTFPGVPANETVDMRSGISISASAVTDRKLTKMAEELCKSKNIKYIKVAAPSSTGTNAPTLNLSGRGVPTIDIGLPIKCMHTNNEILCLDDAEVLSSFIREFICSKEIREAFAK